MRKCVVVYTSSTMQTGNVDDTAWGRPPSVPDSNGRSARLGISGHFGGSSAHSAVGAGAMTAPRNMDGSLRADVTQQKQQQQQPPQQAEAPDVKPAKRRRGSEGTSVDPDEERDRCVSFAIRPP